MLKTVEVTSHFKIESCESKLEHESRFRRSCLSIVKTKHSRLKALSYASAVYSTLCDPIHSLGHIHPLGEFGCSLLASNVLQSYSRAGVYYIWLIRAYATNKKWSWARTFVKAVKRGLDSMCDTLYSVFWRNEC